MSQRNLSFIIILCLVINSMECNGAPSLLTSSDEAFGDVLETTNSDKSINLADDVDFRPDDIEPAETEDQDDTSDDDDDNPLDQGYEENDEEDELDDEQGDPNEDLQIWGQNLIGQDGEEWINIDDDDWTSLFEIVDNKS